MNISNIGIIGVGNMGRSAAEVLKDRYTLHLFDAFRPACDALIAEGYSVYSSPAEVAEVSDVVLMFLPGPNEVSWAVEQMRSTIRPETIIVDHSTVDPESTRVNHDSMKKMQVGYLDAPVLGRPDRAGIWTFPVGGEEADLDEVHDVLNVIAARIIFVGPSGAGNVVKLLNNMMFGVINNVTSEILAATQRLGVSPKVFYETIVESGAATVSNLFKSIGPKMVEQEFSPVFRVELMHKDMDLGLKMAKQAGATMVVSESAQKLTEIALAKGYTGQDSSVVTLISDLISKNN